MAQWLCHVLVHSVVLGVEDVTSRTPCVVGEACNTAQERRQEPIAGLGLRLPAPQVEQRPLSEQTAAQKLPIIPHSPSMPSSPLLLFSGQGSNCSMML